MTRTPGPGSTAPASPGGFRPDWGAPAGVGAWMSTRQGGVSPPPWDSLNLRGGLGDAAECVAENRRRFAQALTGPGAVRSAHPVRLNQVHGTRVMYLDAARVAQSSTGAESAESADAAWTDQPGVACEVQVADCLPVLFCVDDGRAVAAAHAGWRGLAAGVLEATVQALCAGTGVESGRLLAWLGPCIGPAHFEVGADVLHAFGREPSGLGLVPPADFVPLGVRDGQPRWLADLPALAASRLAAAGVQRVAHSGLCTVSDASRFFSFRRDGVTGRQAAAVWMVG